MGKLCNVTQAPFSAVGDGKTKFGGEFVAVESPPPMVADPLLVAVKEMLDRHAATQRSAMEALEARLKAQHDATLAALKSS